MSDSVLDQTPRPTWDEYFMQVVQAISMRATCDRGRSGCVIVSDRQILASGYAGSPPGLPHCDEAGHLFHLVRHRDGTETQHCIRTVHAEQNAICQAAKRGIPISGATVYCRMTPCRHCAMLIISCGIRRVVCEHRYQAGADSEALFSTVNIELTFFNQSIQEY